MKMKKSTGKGGKMTKSGYSKKKTVKGGQKRSNNATSYNEKRTYHSTPTKKKRNKNNPLFLNK